MAVEYTVESFISLRAAYEMLGKIPEGRHDRSRNIENIENKVFACARYLSEKKADMGITVWLCRQMMMGNARTGLNPDTLVKYLTHAEEKNHLEGIRLLAKYYFGWDKILAASQINRARAMELFERAAATGDAESRYELALALLENENGKTDLKRAKSILQALIVERYPAAFFSYYTRFHLMSGGADSDPAYAFQILRQGIEAFEESPQEERDAADWVGERLYYYAGLCHAEGHGCDKDIEKAISLMKISAEINPVGDAYDWLYNKGLERIVELPPAFTSPAGARQDAPQTPKIFTSGPADEEEEQVTRIDLDKPLTFIKFDETKKAEETTRLLTKDDLEDILKPFDSLIGLQNVKDQIRALFYIVLADNRRRATGWTGEYRPSLHMVFSGNPGTGKTTVARLLGEIYKKLGYLKRGHVVEVDRSKLVGEYIGQSEHITAEVIKRAKDGVLFVDEAYDLDVRDSWRDYGAHVTTMLVKAMEDKRDNMVVILAGYRDEMKWFVDSNPGLHSRIGAHIDFPDYTNDELARIFENFSAAHAFEMSDPAKEKIRAVIRNMEPNRKDKMGNARGIRNLFDETLGNQARRVIESNLSDPAELALILPGDIPGSDSPPNKGGGKVTRLSSRR